MITRTARTLAAAALAAASVGLGAVGTAHAATASCGYINIGSPGNVNLHGMYAGQVEQVYNTCNGYTWAHFQWATAYQQGPYRSDTVFVAIKSWSNGGQVTGPVSTAVKDVDSPGMYIHYANPDTFIAYAQVSCAASWGTWHAYADGSNWAGPAPYSC